MDKVFWRDPYCAAMDATVATVSDRRVTLRETIFFAFSGGQESDRGTIGGISVAEAETEGRDIVYTLEDAPHFGPGDTVEVKIDWERRYRLMRLHFAAEIVLAVTTRAIPTIERIGAHISETKSRIDFRLDQPISPWLATFEREANAVIDADRTIISAFSDEETERRYWEISGFDSIPCGGTHIRSTGEIGPIRLSRKNIGRGKERIEITPTTDNPTRPVRCSAV